MIFDRTGEVRDGFFVVGWSHNPLYLLKGKTPILFDGGLALLGKVYREAITSVLNGDSPRVVFITHVHFDHCGAVSYLKKAFPGLEAAAFFPGCCPYRTRSERRKPTWIQTVTDSATSRESRCR